MAELGVVRRVWGVYGGFPEYVYLAAESKARAGNQHTLDITELYTRMVEGYTQISCMHNEHTQIFDPEPWRWYRVGPTGLKPDAYIDTGKRYFLEMDLGTEYRAALTKKINQYVAAYHNWTEQRFPKVLFVCHDSDRLRFITNVIQDQSKPEIFDVCLFDDAVVRLSE